MVGWDILLDHNVAGLGPSGTAYHLKLHSYSIYCLLQLNENESIKCDDSRFNECDGRLKLRYEARTL